MNTKFKALWLNYSVTIPNSPASLKHSAEVPVESSDMAAHHWKFYAVLAPDICVHAQVTDRNT